MKLSYCFLSLYLILVSCTAPPFKSASNGEQITISGVVTNVAPDAFTITSGINEIYVEMDDYNREADGYKLNVGDDVVVTGRVDFDMFEQKKIEAGTVYVRNLDTYFFSGRNDEEDNIFVPAFFNDSTKVPKGTRLDIQGKVTGISGREFIIDSGIREIKVDTSELIYDPMDNIGIPQIDIGDIVKVSGIVSDDVFDTREIEALYVTEVK